MNSQNPQSTTVAVPLTPVQRSALRARAHGLSPVVSIARKGLTASVLQEIERCLSAHELVKIRVFDIERPDREALLAEICAKLGAAPVQHIGKLLVVWREQPKAALPTAVKPAARRRAAPKLTKKAAAAKTERSAKATPRRRPQ